MAETVTYAPGMRIEVRGEEWLVRRMDSIPGHHSRALTVVGVSELVRDKEAVFLDYLEEYRGDKIKVLDPAEVQLQQDSSDRFLHGRLYIESLLRQTPPSGDKLHVGFNAAMDEVPFQFDPTIQALAQPRQRILIADAVGLGKTIEVGILLCELICRGRGRRILVVTLKSLMAQFQKEIWHRFTIPLMRLDSVGIQRVRNHIPTNANPFNYYDKSIISIDTLKNDSEYRVYLENSHWDIIVIDEAQNVAERGNQRSQRAKLARLLAERSEALILASATPFDGDPRSFASLMNMLNPTAIADPEHYGPDDIKGLYLRRFKKDILQQVKQSFKERHISKERSPASPAEEAVFEVLAGLKLQMIDRRKVKGQHLFRTILEKSFFSSPAACLKTLRKRLKRQEQVLAEGGLDAEDTAACQHDIAALKNLDQLVAAITPAGFGKYQMLLRLLKDKAALGWDGRDPADRLVIFTERLETLAFLKETLQKDLRLKEGAILDLDGNMSDQEQMDRVQRFGEAEDPVRLLIASDVAAEGINLHYLSHKMVHFDIPWSLMTFQQRNGRIDRYGQEQDPLIVYLMTEPKNASIRGDLRYLEILIEKDQKAQAHIGDPSSLMGLHDEVAEELRVGEAIENRESLEIFDASLKETPDFLDLLWGEAPVPKGEKTAETKAERTSLFPSDWDYFTKALAEVSRASGLQVQQDNGRKFLTLTLDQELLHIFQTLPREIVTAEKQIHLSADREWMKSKIKALRNKGTSENDNAWLQEHLLWENHPLLEWITHKALAHFRRGEAPVLGLSSVPKGEAWFLVYGMHPNRRGQPVVQDWFALHFKGGKLAGLHPLPDFLGHTHLHAQEFPNTGRALPIAQLEALRSRVIDEARKWMHKRREEFNRTMEPKLEGYLQELITLQDKKKAYIDKELQEKQFMSDQAIKELKDKELREVNRLFAAYADWYTDSLNTEDQPYLRIVAVVAGG